MQTGVGVDDSAGETDGEARPLDAARGLQVPCGVRECAARPGGQPQQEHGQRRRCLEEQEHGCRIGQVPQMRGDDLRGTSGELGGHRLGLGGHGAGLQGAEVPGGGLECAESRVGGCRQGQQCDRQDHRRAGPQAAEGQEHQAEHRVRGEDVAGEEEHGVGCSDEGQRAQAAQEGSGESGAAAQRGPALQREGVAEEEREEQVELRLEHRRDEPAGHGVGGPVEGGVLHSRPVERRGEVSGVDHQDAQQGEAAQCVHVGQTATAARGRGAGHRGGGRRRTCGRAHGAQLLSDGNAPTVWTAAPPGRLPEFASPCAPRVVVTAV